MSTLSNAIPGYLPDAALVADARGGDHSAFEELCKRHSAKLARYLRRLLNDGSDTEDVLQETLFKAFTHLNRFEGRSSFATWLTRIAINNAFMHLRRKRGVTVSIDDTDEDSRPGEAWVLRDSAPDPEDQLIRKQQEEHFAEGIRRLPERLRTVVEMKVREGYTARKIAEELGISEPAVKSRMWRAQNFLREYGQTRANALRQSTKAAGRCPRE